MLRLCHFAIALSLVVFVPEIATAQPSDKHSAPLAAARAKYEAELESLRGQVQTVLDKALETVPKAESPEEAHRLAKAALRAFQSSGTLPDDKLKPQWEQRYSRAARELIQAYFRAGSAYAKEGKADLENAVNEERLCLGSMWDVGPWSSTLSAKEKPETERTVASNSELIVANSVDTADYALDVRAKRLGSNGSLWIETPLSASRSIRIPATVNDKGEVRLLLLIRNGKCLVGLGTSRPVDVNSSKEAETKNINLHADGGSFVIESVRTKPIIDGEPPEWQDQAKQNGQDKPRPQTAADLMPKGSVWRGQVRHNTRGTFDTRLEVVNVTSDSIVTQCSWVGEVRLEFVFSYSGKRLTVSGVRELSNTGGTRAGAGGSGSVSDRAMNTSFSWRVSGGNLQNQSISGSMSLTRQ